MNMPDMSSLGVWGLGVDKSRDPTKPAGTGVSYEFFACSDAYPSALVRARVEAITVVIGMLFRYRTDVIYYSLRTVVITSVMLSGKGILMDAHSLSLY